MKPQGRLGDKSFVAADAHGCPACPHPAVGPAVQGSPNVFVNNRPALRVGDMGIHAACCGPNIWKAVEGSATVFINGKAAHRMGDKDQHCGGSGKMIQGSSNVFVGDSGSGGAALSGCDQSQLRKEAAKSGTPFFEKIKSAIEAAKKAASEMAKKVASEMAKKATETISKGRDKAKEFAEKSEKGWKLKDAELKVESKEGYTDFASEDTIKIGFSVEKKLYDDQLLYYGNENANVKIGHAEASKGFGYGYDPEKGEHKLTLGQVKGKVSVVETEAKGKTAKGLLEGGVKGEALSAKGELTLPSVIISKDKKALEAKAGVEANLVKGEAEGKVNITPKTIYDNTVGSAVGWFSPKSKFTSAPKWLDHGIVIGAKGEAGIGAAAKAEAGAGIEEGVAYAEAGIKLGAGPMAGVKVLLGIK